jgi:hypothetical protein
MRRESQPPMVVHLRALQSNKKPALHEIPALAGPRPAVPLLCINTAWPPHFYPLDCALRAPRHLPVVPLADCRFSGHLGSTVSLLLRDRFHLVLDAQFKFL